MAEGETQTAVKQPVEAMEQASEQQADSVSSDEYNPAPDVQNNVSTEDLAFQSPFDPSTHEDPAQTVQAGMLALPNDAVDRPDLSSNQSLTTSENTVSGVPNLDGAVETSTASPLDVQPVDEHKPSLNGLPSTNGVSQVLSNPSPSHTTLALSPPNDVTLAEYVPEQPDVEQRNTDSVIQAPKTSSFEALTANTAEEKPKVAGEPVPTSSALPKARLPHDTIGILEDRIKEDPLGDVAAWLDLIKEHRQRGKIDDARSVFDRFLTLFPSSAEQWVAYAQMENEAEEKNKMETIFSKSLMQLPNLQLWSLYLDHVRRHHNTILDPSGKARETLHQCYELALGQVGLDKEAGRLWQDYIAFIKQGPGVLGGSGWQDQQKMDLLRKTYQKAVAMPNQSTSALWREYNDFEMGLNKMTGRKFLQEHSSRYMEARGAIQELQGLTTGLRRTSLPVLPPAPGYEGEVEYLKQVEIWKKWIQWEKNDPLVLKDEDVSAYRNRVVFVLKQALMAMRFWPELWFEAAEFCFQNDLVAQGDEFLIQGITANPQSCLLAFKRADRLELSTASSGEDAKQRGAAIREPYDRLLDAQYELISKSKVHEARDLAHIDTRPAANGTETHSILNGDNDDTVEEIAKQKAKEKDAQMDAVKQSYAADIKLISKVISHVWIALLRAMRRVQGKGKVGDEVGGSRQIFSDARKRGRITSDVYVESAMIEYHCYDVEAARRIFERGLKLFPDDEAFALEYIRHLVRTNDHTNARVIFETTVRILLQKPESVNRAKPLFAFFHDFESRYGELAQIVKLEQRMKEYFPEDPSLALFSSRFSSKTFDPVAFRPVISPATQTRPKSTHAAQPPFPQQIDNSNALGLMNNSPKRPAPTDDSDTDSERPRKLARGESPLKGAAGRRVNQQKGHRHTDSAQPNTYAMPQPPLPPPPPTLPRDVLVLLGILPRPDTYKITKFNAARMVDLFRDTHIPRNMEELALLQAARNQQNTLPQTQQRPVGTIPQYAPTPPVSHAPYQVPQAAAIPSNFQQPQYSGNYVFQR